MTDISTDKQLRQFFDERGAAISRKPTFEELCYISGRDPRVWVDRRVFDDLLETIKVQLDIHPDMTLLEVGCAAGFLAMGLSRICSQYTGIDMAKHSIKAARRLGLANADFRAADAAKLPFAANSFDRVVCYDVFTNLADFEVGRPIIREMLRVTKPGGKALIGSVPDEARRDEFLQACQTVSQEMEQKVGPLKTPELKPGLVARLRNWFVRRFLKIQPGFACYDFRKDDFLLLGNELGVKTEFLPVPLLNPYREYRFNVVYSKDMG